MGLNKFFAGLNKTRQAIAQRLAGFSGLQSKENQLTPELLDELEEALILADVGAPSASTIVAELKKSPIDESPMKSLARILENKFANSTAGNNGTVKPRVILIVGVNGSGKTTTIAKLAQKKISEGGKVIMAAADTFRAAAGEQLEIWAERVGADLIRQASGSDPAAVAFDAVKAGISRRSDMVIIDTAGRLQTKSNLMEELKKINKVIGKALPGAPHEVLLVLDATTGQNGLSQVGLFNEALPLTGIVMAKLDGSSKGGILIAAVDRFKIPIKYVGVGEKAEDLLDFNPRSFAEALVGIENDAG